MQAGKHADAMSLRYRSGARHWLVASSRGTPTHPFLFLHFVYLHVYVAAFHILDPPQMWYSIIPEPSYSNIFPSFEP
jgi:hypothetical protein